MRNNSRSGFLGTLVGGGLVVAVLLVVAGMVSIKLNPFKTEHKDHSPPPILTELREISDLHAAQAEFEVIIDDEQDVRYIPAVLAGERVQFVAVGTVDAVVDLSTLTADAVVFDEETNSVVVTLPQPTIGDPVIDHELSHVMNRDRGLFNRIGGLFSDNPTSENALYDAASQKMADAAAASGLVAMAQDQVEDLLETTITRLGVEDVEVRFESTPTQ
ncbi:MAG TPA: DUF4230 domain-containing protein [Ilumatobacteraceae bacterium]|nr:DUF4230 domain-containing protein [Ilumatobacteraceae bacterium]